MHVRPGILLWPIVLPALLAAVPLAARERGETISSRGPNREDV